MAMQNQLQLKIVEIFKKQGIALKNQTIEFQETIHINEMAKEIINDFGDLKTNMNLHEIVLPSKASRAKKAPRPQNKFLLFRKNYSKGLVAAGIKMRVDETSKLASEYWKIYMTNREKTFWNKLSKIANEMHKGKYPEYKYTPNKHQDKDAEKGLLLINKIDNINLPTPVPDSMDMDPIPFDDNDMIIDEKLDTELNELFNFDIDTQFNIQDLYNQNHNSILNQQELLSDFNLYDSLLDPMLFTNI